MINGGLKQRLKKAGFRGSLHQDVPMRTLTSFRIGGPARHILVPQDTADLHVLMTVFNQEEVNFRLLGNGTNLLVSDSGVQEPLVKLTHGFKDVLVEGNRVRAGAGVGLPQLLHVCAEHGLSGLEPLVGIPGTVGGCIRMNAGSWGVEIGDFVSALMVVSRLGQISWRKREELVFSYREMSLPKGEIIVGGEFSLQEGEQTEIKGKIDYFLQKRKKIQPLTMPSAGSIFKNPREIPAGKLIDEMGLKELRRGDAMVSPVHANFIVNLGSARARDVLALIEVIGEKASRQRGIKLVLEVEVVGEP